MSRLNQRRLTEEQVLEQLEIDDFGQLTKANVTQLGEMMDNMPPEVLRKALEQFPAFSETILDLAQDYKVTVEKAIESNDKSMKSCSEMLQFIVESLQSQVDKENVSFEEKKYYIQMMCQVAQMQADKDSENKKFIIDILRYAGTLVAGLGCVALMAIGGKFKNR